jgi:tetratricopeptide (TPR) repeat protein
VSTTLSRDVASCPTKHSFGRLPPSLLGRNLCDVGNKQRLRPVYLLLHRAFPKASIWATAIANGHMRAMWWADEETRRREARSALEWLTRAQTLYRAHLQEHQLSEQHRELYMLWRLRSIAQAALAAGQTDYAERCALEMLRIPDVRSEVMPHHDAEHDMGEVYDARIILGKVALARGDVDSAERYLLDAAATWPADSVKKTYGPDFELAAGLLREDRAAAVLSYLRASRRFTVFLDEQIDHWIREIEEGRTPDFRDWRYVKITPSRVIRTVRAQWRSYRVWKHP